MVPEAALLVELSLRMSAVLALAWMVTLAMPRAAAATRHLVWACAVAAVILLPAMQAVVPEWRIVPSRALPRVSSARVPVASPATAVTLPTGRESSPRERTAATGAPPAGLGMSIATPALAIWLTGAAFVLAYMLLGIAASWRIRRQSTRSPVNGEAGEMAEALGIRVPVAVVESPLAATPLVCGVWRPRIVLPRDVALWSEERRHVVVLHELAHIKRRDCLTQAIAQLVCAVYWFNPLAWVAARRLRVERERACDDFVLTAGVRGSDYAQHLLGIAQSAPRVRLAPVAAGVAMARRTQLEGRLMAILDPAIRRSPARHAGMWAVALVAGLSLPIAAVRPKAAPPLPTDVSAASLPSQPPAVVVAADASTASTRQMQPRRSASQAAAAPQQTAKKPVQDAALLRTLNLTLIEFADEGHYDGVLRMLDAGADVNGEGLGDGSPLIAAADEGHVDIVRLLLDRGANPNIAVPGDGSPLIAAAGEGHTDVVRLLLDRGADANLMVEGDENALIQAAGEGHLEIVRLLVSRGADVNAVVWEDRLNWSFRDQRGLEPERRSERTTALSEARREGHVDIVTYLISAGARD